MQTDNVGLTNEQRVRLRGLAKLRQEIVSPIDRIVFDNRRLEGMPPLPLGLLLLAVEGEDES